MKRLVLFLFLITPLVIYSQNEAAIWYFGENAGLDFNSGAPVVLTDGEISTFEGCATISDSAGNLLFYTDGVTVWDSTHTIMPNGTNLLGDISSTQSAIIVPKPANLNQYYIFTVDARGFSALSADGINYSTVDLTLNGNLGDIIPSEKNIPLVSQAYEKITAVQHADNNSFWVISYIQDQFLAWRVDATGVNTTPVISNVSNAPDSRGYLKISPDGKKIACANFGNVSNMVIYDFNDATGSVTNEVQLTLDNPNDVPYGVEFSVQSKKLYVTTSQLNVNEHITPGKLIQYDMLSPVISNSRVLIHTSNVNTRGALQLAIDGKIYRALSISGTAQEGTAFLGIINDPEADGLACNYVHDALDISAGDPNRKVIEGLPPFIQSFFLSSISATDVCIGDLTQFTFHSTTTPTSISWDFGDPSTGANNFSTLTNPTHLFSSSGIFTVTATVTVGLEISVITLDVTIYDPPVVTSPVTLIQCDDDLDGVVDFNLNEANQLISTNYLNESFTYFLTQNDALNNINPIATPTAFSNATTSTVWARIENVTNCFATAEVNLQITSTSIPPGLMITFNECDNIDDGDDTNGFTTFDFSTATALIETALLPVVNLAVSYYETIPDALAEINPINETNYINTTSNSQQIVVRVDDLNNGCFGLGYHITLNVDPVPIFDLDNSADFCLDGSTHSISVQNPMETYTYVWENPSGTIIGTTSSVNVTTQGLHTVTATKTDGTGCVKTKSIQVNLHNLPIVTSPVTLIQCDDDIDGIVDFNLNEANQLISTNYLNELFTYFLTQNDALNNINPISNPTTFSNATTASVWARIENVNNCYTTAEINLQITSTSIPPGLMIAFNECDDIADGDDNNGITTFDFSTATALIETALLPVVNLAVSYYETIPDALAEINPINETNYINTTSNSQQIVVRVDDLNNECFGLGYHITLNVDPVPIYDLGNSADFCLDGSTHSISVQNPMETYTYVWENPSGTIIGTTSSVNVTTQGLHTVTATKTDGTGCVKTKSIQVNLHNLPIVTSPVTLIQCDDDIDGIIDFNLNEANQLISTNYLNESFTYFLTQNEALNNINPISNPITFSNATTASVWSRIVNSNNCFTTAQINLDVISINIPSDLMVTINECDDIIDGDDNNGITTFDFSSANQQILNALLPETDLSVTYYHTDSDALTEINPINPTNYRNTTSYSQQIVVRVDSNSIDCFKIETLITLNVNSVPEFDLLDSLDLCFLSLDYEIGIENPADNYEYQWRNSHNISMGNTPSIIINTDGVYTVTATNENNCVKTKSILVNSVPVAPLLDFDRNNIQLIDNSINNTITVLTTNLPISIYEFSLDNSVFSLDNFFENVPTGLHTVKIRDVENCLESSIEISVISIPNFFTPNGDGFNDTWHVTGIKFQPTSNIYIFDRFGKLITILEPLGPGWNGLYNGNPLPSTDYWYKVELDDERVLKGHFSLIR